jgi:hypothetical protein
MVGAVRIIQSLENRNPQSHRDQGRHPRGAGTVVPPWFADSGNQPPFDPITEINRVELIGSRAILLQHRLRGEL